MMKTFTSGLYLCLILFFLAGVAIAQQENIPPIQSLEISDDEGIPVIIKHLPNWETKKNNAVFISSIDGLRNALGERSVFEAIEFIGDTEAVTANYGQGKLLIVEYGTPQASVDTDKKVKRKLSDLDQVGTVFYRRIGNYNVFLFDGANEAAANTLFDQIKYQKVVRWLGINPFIQRRAERNFIRQTSSLFIATVITILSGTGFAIIIGFFSGIIFYNIRRQKRASMVAFSDGGGLTRLNLDQLTSDIGSVTLLND